VLNVAGAQTNPPALLTNIYGLELHLDGISRKLTSQQGNG